MRTLLRSLLVAIPALTLAVVACRKAPGSGGDVGDAAVPPPNRCEADLGLDLSGTGAVARVAAAGDLIGGEAANGRTGDFLLANDKIRVLIQQPDRHIGPLPFGGNIIDADVIRPAGEPGRDSFGEIGPFYQFARTANVDSVEVLRDGSEGGPAVIAATGTDTLDDFINVNSVISGFTSGALRLRVDTEAELPLRLTTYYVLSPGQKRVQLVTAICNQGAKALLLPVGDLMDTGGDVAVYNPSSKAGGYGVSYSEIADTPELNLVAKDTAYGYLPATTQNQTLVVAGVVGSLVGSSGILDWLDDGPRSGALKIPANGSASYRRDLVVGRTLSEVRDTTYELRGTATGAVSGVVTRGGAPLAGARVAAVHPTAYTYKAADGSDRNETRNTTESVFITNVDGAFSGKLPLGTYAVSAWAEGSTPSADVQLAVTAAGAKQDMTLEAPARLTITARDAVKGTPMPAKVAVQCLARCPGRDKLIRFFDSHADPAGDDVERVLWLDARGEATVDVPPGTYEILASRGIEYSSWPDTWPTVRGARVTLAAGANPTVAATLSRVVDTTGWMSGDFHVHGINSPDSPVPLIHRVLTFMTEGVDVMVSTDHDFITDYAPTVASLDALSPAGTPRASDFLSTMVGVELTTFDYGHVNAFPLTPKQGDLNGGAFDWAGGLGANHTPGEIFAGLKALPGPDGAERVVQLNHPRGGSFFGALKVDTRTFASHADPTTYRMPAHAPDASGDTGLFDKGFTAMEVMNNIDEKQVHQLMNDWFTFTSRGFLVTGTAVSDTHTRNFNGAYGRSFCNVGVDKPSELTPGALARAVNAHKVVNSIGPFISVVAESGAEKKGVGEVLATAGKPVKLTVTVQSPTWMSWDRIEVHTYRAGTEAKNGNPNDSWPADGADGLPTTLEAAGLATLVDLKMETPVAGAEGGMRYLVKREFTATPTADTWFVVIVRRPKGIAFLAPQVSASKDNTLVAFTNPILIDVDGGGYDKFPMTSAPLPTPEPEGTPRDPTVDGLLPAKKPLIKFQKRELLEQAFGDTNHINLPKSAE